MKLRLQQFGIALIIAMLGHLMVLYLPLIYEPGFRSNSLGFDFVPIKFQFGKEKPYLLFFQTTETTRRQWSSLMKLPETQDIRCGDCPVSEIGRQEILEFVNRLNAREGCHLSHDQILGKHGSAEVGGCYRVPTIKEWTHACLGDKPSPFGLTKAEENVIMNHSWSSYNAFIRAKPVGQKAPNGFGLYDMLGNVRELAVWDGNLAKDQNEELRPPLNDYSNVKIPEKDRKQKFGRVHDYFYPVMNGSYLQSPAEEFSCSYSSLEKWKGLNTGFRIVRYPDRID